MSQALEVRTGLTSLDEQALALLQLLRDHPNVQKDPRLHALFSAGISFVSTPTTAVSQPARFRDFSTVSHLVIDTSGEDGGNGLPGTGGPVSAFGLNGHDGSDGTDARDIHLCLTFKDGKVEAKWDEGIALLELTEATASIALRALGGNGGPGGYGGRGGNGLPGSKGADATRFSRGQDGQRGRPGGSGGVGGAGGKGGKGGNIQLVVAPEDADLLMLLNPPTFSGGLGGRGGPGGKGGAGGPGGEGGASLTWSEPRTAFRMVLDGHGRSHMESYTTTVPRYNPSGSRGIKGADGVDAANGISGMDSARGSFQMTVGGRPYPALYNLAITVSKIADLSFENSADFYEPGEPIRFSISVDNTGGMPTPPQEIDISLHPADWYESVDKLAVLSSSKQIEPGEKITLPRPFALTIADHPVSVGRPFAKHVELVYQAVFKRIGKPFPPQKSMLLIRYPVQISLMKAPAVLPVNQSATLSLTIENVSSIDMGKEGPQNRQLFVDIEIADNSIVKSEDVQLSLSQNSCAPLRFELDRLLPKEKRELSFSFRVTNPLLPPIGSTALISASLYLDDFHTPKRSRCIQRQLVEVQLT